MRKRASLLSAVFVLIITALAIVLRLYRLGAQSLWYDEAFSVYLARMNLGDITARTAADIQPPLYYYLLHFWMELAGDGEFAVRFLSLFFGVLTVPLMFVIARRLFNPAAAIFSALLALFSPLYLWYSQETRMYSLITFLLAVSKERLFSAAYWRGIPSNHTESANERSVMVPSISNDTILACCIYSHILCQKMNSEYI
jgi:mannosyltransferase